MSVNEISGKIIGASIEIHRHFGPGLLESAYRECLRCELKQNGLYVQSEMPMPIIFKDMKLDHGYRMDLLIENQVVVELKTVEALNDVHFAQLLTYLRLGNFRLGLLMNFYVAVMKNGIRRVVNNPRELTGER